jgi:hypothetical protein
MVQIDTINEDSVRRKKVKEVKKAFLRNDGQRLQYPLRMAAATFPIQYWI